MERMTNIKDWTEMRYEDLVKLAQDLEQWRIRWDWWNVKGLRYHIVNSKYRFNESRKLRVEPSHTAKFRSSYID